MNTEKLKLALIQSDILWEDIAGNLSHLDSLLLDNIVSADIIVLPEMFSTGFSMKTNQFSETLQEKTFEWMKVKSKQYNAAITGSIIFCENGHYFNRLFWINPDDQWFHYDKRHLFSMGGEDKFYEPGKTRLIVEFRGWKICPLICYDLRFPVWSRNNMAYDLLVYVANWPAARNHVWNILLRARAIENQCFVVGVNRVGRDGENIHYTGESCVVHPKGYYTVVSHEPEEQVIQCTIDMKELNDFRKKFPVLNDADYLIGKHM